MPAEVPLSPLQHTHISIQYNQWQEYALWDSGNFQKLERFGDVLLIRSEPKAWWKPVLSQQQWRKARAVCDAEGRWQFEKDCPREWIMAYQQLRFQIRCTDMSKHVGIFPEQSPHWEWIKNQLQQAKKSKPAAGLPAEPTRVLSLFGYTGASALVAASNGAVVTQIDASKPALSWAKHNQQLSGLRSIPIRFLLDDALKFLKRESRRNSRYDALIIDPPSFGRGPKGEVWKAEKSLPTLLEHCAQVLSDQPLFILLNMYALEASALMLGNLLSEIIGERGSIEIGELALQPNYGNRPLPLAIFARWSIAG